MTLIIFWNKIKRKSALDPSDIVVNNAADSTCESKNEYFKMKEPGIGPGIYATNVDLDDSAIITGADYHLSDTTLIRLEDQNRIHMNMHKGPSIKDTDSNVHGNENGEWIFPSGKGSRRRHALGNQ